MDKKDYIKKAKIILHQNNINTKGYSLLRAVGNSMFPTIVSYQKVLIINYKNYKIGDIVAFRCNTDSNINDLVCHRIIDIYFEQGYTKIKTKGDNNIADRYSRPFSYVLGKVLYSEIGKNNNLIFSDRYKEIENYIILDNIKKDLKLNSFEEKIFKLIDQKSQIIEIIYSYLQNNYVINIEQTAKKIINIIKKFHKIGILDFSRKQND